MNKLELKHLAPYLPYGLRIKGKNLNPTTLNHDCLDWVLNRHYKPILRPLTDLTKEIEVNGEKFVSINKFGLVANEDNMKFIITKVERQYMSYLEMQYLIKWHFDVFGLIPESLAIDINTLKQ
jgi:hypothetical protein